MFYCPQCKMDYEDAVGMAPFWREYFASVYNLSDTNVQESE